MAVHVAPDARPNFNGLEIVVAVTTTAADDIYCYSNTWTEEQG
jgi:hypothetical protein